MASQDYLDEKRNVATVSKVCCLPSWGVLDRRVCVGEVNITEIFAVFKLLGF